MTTVDIDAMTLADQADALRRAGYPDPLRWDNVYIPSREDIERAVRGEGPPANWFPRHLCQEQLYIGMGGTDPAAIREMQRRDRETAHELGGLRDEEWTPAPPSAEARRSLVRRLASRVWAVLSR